MCERENGTSLPTHSLPAHAAFTRAPQPNPEYATLGPPGCLYSTGGRRPVEDRLFMCKTCTEATTLGGPHDGPGGPGPGGGSGSVWICQACSETCHRRHELVKPPRWALSNRRARRPRGHWAVRERPTQSGGPGAVLPLWGSRPRPTGECACAYVRRLSV